MDPNSTRPPPPPYSQEYTKPPPYFEGQSAGAGGASTAASAQPQNYPPPPASGGWYPPPPGEVPRVHESHQQTGRQGQTQTVIAVTTQPYVQPGQQQVLILGNCPSCRIGFLRNEFDLCGIVLAILFFPIGVLCCLCMMEKRCSHCGARF